MPPDAAPKASRWTGSCYRCKREREIETRYTHGAQTLCDECADIPHKRPTATGLDVGRGKKAQKPSGERPLAVIMGSKVEVFVDDRGKLKLPPAPAPTDTAGQCAWLTAALALDPAHPITGGVREGGRGAEGHVVLTRLGAGPLRFEPASRINTALKLIEDLCWRGIPSDPPPHALKNEHCKAIAHVIRQLCGASLAESEAHETTGIVGHYLHTADAEEGYTTYGTPQQRYEAAQALRRDRDGYRGPRRYLIDSNTGELVIAVGDLAEAARQLHGSLARGWLDARMENLEWQRVRLDGRAQSGRAGRGTGYGHATVNVYRGHLPAAADDNEAVTK